MEQKKKIKVIIIVLAVLLGVSLLALGGTIAYNRLANNEPAVVTVPDNLITPEEDTTKTDGNDTESTDAADKTTKPEETPSDSTKKDETSGTTGTTDKTAETKKAAAIELYNKQPEDNTPFNVGNMFPGDSETKYFRVQVSYHDKVTVHYKATVREGCEKLAEVLKVKVKLLTTGETMYDGLMKDMPDSVTYNLVSAESTTDELYYEITAYLDTSVGNEYQNKDLIADFSWWVQETGNLGPSPQTGDNAHILLWICLAAVSGSMMIFLLFVRKRREEEETND